MLLKTFILWTYVLIARPQDFFTSLAAVRPALLATLISIFLFLIRDSKDDLTSILTKRDTRRYLFFYAIMLFGIPFSYHRWVSFKFVFYEYSVNILYFIVFISLIRTIRDLKKIILTLMLCVFSYSIFVFISGVETAGRLAFGSMFDANDLAFYLVSLFPLSMFFILRDEGKIKRVIGYATCLLAISSTILTGSRGGLLGLVVVTLMLLLSKNLKINATVKTSLLVVVIGYLALFSNEVLKSRYSTFLNLSKDYNITREFGRLDIWRSGVHLIFANPLTGVGTNNFQMAIGYQREVQGVTPRWQAPHNSFLQVGAEMGLIGLALYISMTIYTLKTFYILGKSKNNFGADEGVPLLSNLLFISFSGSIICSIFLTQGYSFLFTIFLALACSLSTISQTEIQS